ncbi:Uncharacterized protein APZ42_030433, partial [Daphnia magna]
LGFQIKSLKILLKSKSLNFLLLLETISKSSALRLRNTSMSKKICLVLFLLADQMSTAVLNARSILAEEHGIPIISFAIGAKAGNLC